MEYIIKEKDIEKNNELIAEFMGCKRIKQDTIEKVYYIPEYSFDRYEQDEYYGSEMKYHSSWDWLMPVVSYYNFRCHFDFAETHKNIVRMSLCRPNIENVYKAIVAFIKWYNKVGNLE